MASSADSAVAVDSTPTELASEPTPSCASPWVVLTADASVLVAPPLQVTIHASSEGVDLDGQCEWQFGPSNVCKEGGASNRLRRTGHGICTAICKLSNGLCGSLALNSQRQDHVYIIGGEVTAFPPPATAASDAARIQRLRTIDGQWDTSVGYLPEFRIQPAVASDGSRLWVFGGETGGNYTAIDFWDVFFPACAEAILTPTQLKAEVGCRAVRRWDLATGKWTAPLQWPHPRVGAQTLQDGNRVYLLGGQRSKTVTEPKIPESFASVDLTSATLTTPPSGVPAEMIDGSAPLWWPGLPAALWQGELLACGATGSWRVEAATGKWTVADLGWPCAELAPSQVIRPPNRAELWVVPSEQLPSGGLCAPCRPVASGGAPTCQPQRWDGTGWSAAPPMPYGRLVAAPDALYVLGEKATYRFNGVDAWLAIAPPMPYGRFGFAAVAVSQ